MHPLSEVGGWEICSICYWEDDEFRGKERDFRS
ncbi:hypothetical protein J4G50_37290 [Burkholderia anthina]|nr:hypothetical protein J4G50_37290 [Burkholderia anthina]